MTTVDFGPSARDYAKHRPGFPPELFDRAATLGVGHPGQRVLDLGTGTGTLALGFAERGCVVTGLDPSPEMLAQATRISSERGLNVRWMQGRAESTGLEEGGFDVVCAGQCWHWFDRGRAAAEALRLLAPRAHVLIAYFSYLPDAGSLAEATERLVLRHNPSWTMAGLDGRYPMFADDLTAAGCSAPTLFDFVVDTPFTHEGWRGRFRACHGVLTLPPETLAAFDADLAELLRAYPEPVIVPHRVFGIVAAKP